jgi:hypothetical protein
VFGCTNKKTLLNDTHFFIIKERIVLRENRLDGAIPSEFGNLLNIGKPKSKIELSYQQYTG